MSEKKEDQKDDPPEISLKTEYFDVPLITWIFLVLAFIGVIIAIYAVARRGT